MEEQDVLADLQKRYNLGPAGQALLRAIARVFAELDEETACRLIDETLVDFKFAIAAARHTHDPAAHVVPDPQSPADSESSVPFVGSDIG